MHFKNPFPSCSCCTSSVAHVTPPARMRTRTGAHTRTHARTHAPTRTQDRDYGEALRHALMACEEELMAAHLTSGSTALVALMVDAALFLANVGDCRAVVGARRGGALGGPGRGGGLGGAGGRGGRRLRGGLREGRPDGGAA